MSHDRILWCGKVQEQMCADEWWYSMLVGLRLERLTSFSFNRTRLEVKAIPQVKEWVHATSNIKGTVLKAELRLGHPCLFFLAIPSCLGLNWIAYILGNCYCDSGMMWVDCDCCFWLTTSPRIGCVSVQL